MKPLEKNVSVNLNSKRISKETNNAVFMYILYCTRLSNITVSWDDEYWAVILHRSLNCKNHVQFKIFSMSKCIIVVLWLLLY